MAAVAGVGVCGGISGVVEPGGKASGVVGFEGQNSFDEAESICIAGGTWKHVIRKPPFSFLFYIDEYINSTLLRLRHPREQTSDSSVSKRSRRFPAPASGD